MPSDDPSALDVFISYSHRDEKLRDELETHLALLKRERSIRTWHDRHCFDREMARALERHELGQSRVVPVILRPVDWQTAIFARLR